MDRSELASRAAAEKREARCKIQSASRSLEEAQIVADQVQVRYQSNGRRNSYFGLLAQDCRAATVALAAIKIGFSLNSGLFGQSVVATSLLSQDSQELVKYASQVLDGLAKRTERLQTI